MSFSSKPFNQRFNEMGDMSETNFKQWADRNSISYVAYGLNRPPFRSFQTLPLVIRGTPDFLCEGKSKFFVECKGTGGRVLKIKPDSLKALEAWNSILNVWMFVYNSKQHTASFLPFRVLSDVALASPLKAFEVDNKPYHEINVSKLTWFTLEKIMTDKTKEELEDLKTQPIEEPDFKAAIDLEEEDEEDTLRG